MADTGKENRALSEEELQELVAASDAGARSPEGSVGKFLAIVAVIWSVFQVVLASPLANYILPGDIINNLSPNTLGVCNIPGLYGLSGS